MWNGDEDWILTSTRQHSMLISMRDKLKSVFLTIRSAVSRNSLAILPSLFAAIPLLTAIY